MDDEGGGRTERAYEIININLGSEFYCYYTLLACPLASSSRHSRPWYTDEPYSSAYLLAVIPKVTASLMYLVSNASQ